MLADICVTEGVDSGGLHTSACAHGLATCDLLQAWPENHAQEDACPCSPGGLGCAAALALCGVDVPSTSIDETIQKTDNKIPIMTCTSCFSNLDHTSTRARSGAIALVCGQG
jgi:hypothetical protein